MKHTLLLMFGLACAVPAFAGPPVTAPPTYAKSIQPILKERCVVCHNQATLGNPSISGGLALDSFAALQKGVVGASVPTAVLIPGKSAQSVLLVRLLATSPAKMMPKGGPPLSPAEIALVRKWIDIGAPSGLKGNEISAATVSPASLPMPTSPNTQDVAIRTQLKPTPDLLTKETPKDASVALALPIGPLPPITALAYSPDGKRLAVGGYRAVTFWDTATGQPVACITHLAGPVLSLAYRPDGTQLAVAGGATGVSGEVRIFDSQTLAPAGAPLLGHTDLVYSVAWSADGKRLATGSQDKTARLWDWPSGKELHAFKEHSDSVTGICLSPDSKTLYTASLDHNVRRYDIASGQLVRALTGHSDAVTALALSPNGQRLVSSGTEPSLRWWNPDTGDTTNNNGGHGGPVNALVFSKDGKYVASASADHTVRLWDAGSTGQIRALEGPTDWLYTVAFSPDDKFTAGGGAEGTVQLWETATGRLRLTLVGWPPPEGTTVPEWAVITPEGYFNASPNWTKRLKPLLAGNPIPAPRVMTFVRSLRQPDSIAKAWQDAPLTTAILTALPEAAAKTASRPKP